MTMHELFRPHNEGAFWQMPNELPDLRRVGIIALDTEESDEGLRAGHGAGWAWRGGYICGISIAWRDPENGEIRGAYFPIAHLDSKNFERVNVVRWLRDHIAAGVRFIMHNAVFDLGWLLMDLGVAMPPSSQLEDTGVMATTINENRPHFSLAALCDAYDLPGKNETLLIQAIEAAGFKINKKTPRNPTSRECRRALSARMPKPMRLPRSRCSKNSARCSSRKTPRRRTGWTSICCR
jgi:hypothetical protein